MTSKIYISSHDVILADINTTKQHSYLIFDPNFDGDDDYRTSSSPIPEIVDFKILRGSFPQKYEAVQDNSLYVEVRDITRNSSDYDSAQSSQNYTEVLGLGASQWQKMWEFAKTMGNLHPVEYGAYDTDFRYEFFPPFEPNSNSVINTLLSIVDVNFRDFVTDGHTADDFPGHMGLLDGSGDDVFTAFAYSGPTTDTTTFFDKSGNDYIIVKNGAIVNVTKDNDSTTWNNIVLDGRSTLDGLFLDRDWWDDNLEITSGSSTIVDIQQHFDEDGGFNSRYIFVVDGNVTSANIDTASDTISGTGITVLKQIDTHVLADIDWSNLTSSIAFSEIFTSTELSANVTGDITDDYLFGGTGDNVLLGGAGNDYLDGGYGFDAADYSSATSAFNITINGSGFTTISDGLGGTDTLHNIEKIIATDYDDEFIVTSHNHIRSIDGGVGTDHLYINYTSIDEIRAIEDPNNPDHIWYQGSDGSVFKNFETIDSAIIVKPEKMGSSFVHTDISKALELSYELQSSGITANFTAGTVTGASGTDHFETTAITFITGTDYTDQFTAGNDPYNDRIVVYPGLGDDVTIIQPGQSLNYTFSGGNDVIQGMDGISVSFLLNLPTVSSLSDIYTTTTSKGSNLYDLKINVTGYGSVTLEDIYISSYYDSQTNTYSYGINPFYAAGVNASVIDQGVFYSSNYDLSYNTSSASSLNTWLEPTTFYATDTGYIATNGNDMINLSSASSSVTINSGAGNDTITGSANGDSLSLGDGNDTAFGLAANDTIIGGYGNDTLDGGAGSDYVYGGVGDDALIYSFAENLSDTDQYFGNVGSDTLTIHASEADLLAANLTQEEVATLFEQRLAYEERLEYFKTFSTPVRTENNVDIYEFDFGYEVSFDFNASTSLIFTDFEALNWAYTNSYDANSNLILGSESDENFDGLAGNDVIVAGGGDDFITGGAGDDYIVGGDGFDSADYSSATSSVTVNLRTQTANDGLGGIDTIRGVEELLGSSYADSLTGNDDDNNFIGGAGNDTLDGSGGDDFLIGEEGDDVLKGDVGDDILFGDEGADFLEGNHGEDDLFGGDGNDTLVGDEGDDFLDGGAGDDTIYGGDDDDTILAGSGGDIIYAGSGNDTVDGGAGVDSLWGGVGNDVLNGGSGQNYLYGEDGDDRFIYNYDEVNGAYQYFYAGLGTDTLVINATADVYASFKDELDYYNYYLTHNSNENTTGDVQYASAGILLSDFETVEVYADGVQQAHNNIVFGTSSLETIVATSFNDTIYAYEGDDTLYGEDGDDRLFGGDGNDALYGNAGNDVLFGGAGDDTLYGGDGDTLYGGLGDDELRGYGGVSYFYGDDGTDKVWWRDYVRVNDVLGLNVDLAATVEYGTALDGDGNESRLYGIENLVGSSYADILKGDDAVNVIYGGADYNGMVDGDDTIYGYGGNDELYGYSGNDTIYGGDGDDMIRGNDGDDILYGGDGVDDIIGDDGADIIYAGAGNDTVYAGAGTDTVYGGDGDDVLRGQEDLDMLYGDDGADYLYGYGDNDVLDGGLGTDHMYGGDGDDTIIFSEDWDYIYGNAGADTFVASGTGDFDMSYIYDFVESVDKLDLTDLLDGYSPGTDALSDFVNIAQGNHTTVQVDRDGAGDTYGWDNIVRLQGNTTISTDVGVLHGNGTLIVPEATL